MTEPLVLSFDIDCEPEHAFGVWTTKLSSWWPADHTVSGEKGAEIVLEDWPGGRIFERTRAGDVHEWGRITVWEPPRRLVYQWHLAHDPAEATEVEIRFIGRGTATTVEIAHRGWERLGAAGPQRRRTNRAGWDGVLPHFVAACAS